jgi:hypothetical protein
MAKGYILVEGQGDVAAAGNLVARLWNELGAPFPWAKPMRWKNLHQADGLARGAEYVRRRSDARALLALRDEDDRCPKEEAPRMGAHLRSLGLSCPAAVVLLHPEYEVLFLPCIEQMAGRPLPSPSGERPGVVEGTTWEGDWERLRGIKEWLTAQFPANRAYKPTVDQLPLTQMIDFPTLREAGLPSFDRLERALKFLRGAEGPGLVYPPGSPHLS